MDDQVQDGRQSRIMTSATWTATRSYGTGSGTMNATVTVTYANDRSKSAEVGVRSAPPVTLMDFELINGQRQTCAHNYWGKSTTWITA